MKVPAKPHLHSCRHFASWVALTWLASAFSVFAAGRVNILLINADDHRPDGIHALGNPTIRTPNLDRLVQGGFSFRHAYTMGSLTTAAVCLPSRTQLLTGLSLMHVTPIQFAGVRANVPPVDMTAILPTVFAAAGYETFHIGKSGNEFRVGIEAFDHNLVRNDQTVPERRTSSRVHADEVIRFLKSRKMDKPFLIYLAPPVPHDPRVAEERFHKLYDPAKIPLPINYLPQHPFNNGEMTIRDEKLLSWPRTESAVRKEIADYYACITGLDYHLGRIFDCLKQLGQWDNTLVVFLGDNGLSLGEHGLLGKQNLYEFGGMHVPLVFFGPGIPHGETRAFAYMMDLFPTLCDLAGIKSPASLDGASLAPILRGHTNQIHDFCFTAYFKCQRAIRDDRWKLIRYPLIAKDQLFDLQADPHEMNDLSSKPELSGKLAEMTDLLRRAQKSFGDTAPLAVANPLPAVWSPPNEESIATPKKNK